MKFIHRWICLFWISTCLGTGFIFGAEEKTPGSEPPLPEELSVPPFQFAMVEYDGGSWTLMRSEMELYSEMNIPAFIRWSNQQKVMSINETVKIIRLTDKSIFNYPMLYMAGRFGFELSDEEKTNLKEYIQRGGFLIAEDFGNPIPGLKEYGKFSDKIEEILKAFFPTVKNELLPKSHSVFKSPFMMPRNKPAVINSATYDPEKDDVVPLGGPDQARGGCRVYLKGFFYKDRMISFYKNAGNCSGGLLSARDPVGDKTYKLWANIMVYGMTH